MNFLTISQNFRNIEKINAFLAPFFFEGIKKCFLGYKMKSAGIFGKVKAVGKFGVPEDQK